MTKELGKTVSTPTGRLLWTYIAEPNKDPKYGLDKQGNPQYMTDLIFTAHEVASEEFAVFKDTVLKIVQAQDSTVKSLDSFSENYRPIKPLDAKVEAGHLPAEYMGGMYIKAKTKFLPRVFSPSKAAGELSKEQIATIKSGDYARLVVSPYYYKAQSKGVSTGLVLVQYVKTGSALGGNVVAAAIDSLQDMEISVDDVSI